jgi:myo-inositol-hexaphosphate 3-phosphohydrolase
MHDQPVVYVDCLDPAQSRLITAASRSEADVRDECGVKGCAQ